VLTESIFTLKMEATRSSENLVPTYQIARCHNTEAHHLKAHPRAKSENSTPQNRIKTVTAESVNAVQIPRTGRLGFHPQHGCLVETGFEMYVVSCLMGIRMLGALPVHPLASSSILARRSTRFV
jgi:hypothetical protein